MVDRALWGGGETGAPPVGQLLSGSVAVRVVGRGVVLTVVVGLVRPVGCAVRALLECL